jgi:hypothetical protein
MITRLAFAEEDRHFGVPTQAEQSRTVLQNFRELCWRHSHMLFQPQHQTGINAAAPRRHDQPF